MRINSDFASLKDLLENGADKRWVKCKKALGTLSEIACDDCVNTLTTHWDSNIRCEAVKIPSLSSSILKRMSLDYNETIASIAKARLNEQH
jgi:hypothetical protein